MVKIRLPELAAVPQSSKVQVEFQDRAFKVHVSDYDGPGKHYVFGVPKLQCRINSGKSTWKALEKHFEVTLIKEKEDDNWHSLFYSRAIGANDSD